mgnify:CR=1 FL=1
MSKKHKRSMEEMNAVLKMAGLVFRVTELGCSIQEYGEWESHPLNAQTHVYFTTPSGEAKSKLQAHNESFEKWLKIDQT